MNNKTKLPTSMPLTEAEIVALHKDSYGAIQCKVQGALDLALRTLTYDPYGEYCYSWVSDLYDDQVVFTIKGAQFIATYSIDDAGNVMIGTPSPVQTAYVSVDAAKESARVLVTSAIDLKESINSKGNLTVTVIEAGLSKNNRLYSKEMLARDHSIFDGVKMFTNHDDANGVKEWVATVGKTWIDKESGSVLADVVVHDEAFKKNLENLSDAKLLTKMAVSINAVGEADDFELDGKMVKNVTNLLAARSVDFVAHAGAGGRVEAIESVVEELDLDLVNLAQLRERRPDLIKIIEGGKEPETMSKSLEQQLSEMSAELKAEKEKIATMESAAKKAVVKAELSKLVAEAKLPTIAVTRIEKQFENAEVIDGIKEAVTAEAEYIKSLGTPAIEKHNGTEDNGTVTATPLTEAERIEKRKDAIKGYRALGLNEAEATKAAEADENL